MRTLFLLFVFFTIWHFFYENIIASTFRQNILYKYYALRDRLRRIEVSTLDEKDYILWSKMDFVINKMIMNIEKVSLGRYYFIRKKIIQEQKRAPKKETEDFRLEELVNNTKNEELKDIFNSSLKYGSSALFINNGGWIIYLLIPISLFFISVVLTAKTESIINKVRRITNNYLYSKYSLSKSYSYIKN